MGDKDVGINTQDIRPVLTLSFHCFAANEVRGYLCFNGWGTRFFIEDIKYFLPEFFVEEQRGKLEEAFKRKDQVLAQLYMRCKKQCSDEKFEKFYSDLLNIDAGQQDRKVP